jgi:hypothetical protein
LDLLAGERILNIANSGSTLTFFARFYGTEILRVDRHRVGKSLNLQSPNVTTVP